VSRRAAIGRFKPNKPGHGYGKVVRTASLIKILSAASLDSFGSVTSIAEDWNPGAFTFVEGTADFHDLSLTGPFGSSVGGIYSVDSGTLPAGVTLSDVGMLSYDGVGIAGNATVVFAYSEQNSLPVLTLHSTSAGTFPYMATVYPCEGAVPSGKSLSSLDDSTLRGKVLTTWPDGSAQVMVVAGRKAVAASSTTNIRLRPATPTGVNLTTANIASKFTTGITVNFGTPLPLNTWTSPDRIWWATPEVICARYRLPITNKGAMEAVIDVHAFADNRALVEVVIENGKTDCNAATVTAPAAQSYTNATVSVNGTQIQPVGGVSSPTEGMAVPNSNRSGGTYNLVGGGHDWFRAWYCSGWIGGDPQIEVTHDAASMQAHPWFYKQAVAMTVNMQTRYTTQAYDTYVPWATCRLRIPGMDGTGGTSDEEIALFTQTNADYFLTGNKYARRATIQNGLARLSIQWNWRHTDGVVPTPAQAATKNQNNGKWPPTTSGPRWSGDESHAPINVLVPFLCHPSPCFIELAQKAGIWNHTNFSSTNGAHNWDQLRARGWRLRNYGVTAYLTPDVDLTTKDQWRNVIYLESEILRTMLDHSWNTIGALWNYRGTGSSSGDWEDQSTSRPNYQTSMFQHDYVVMALHSVSGAKVLTGTNAVALDTLADRVCRFIVEWITEAVGYEWRALPYQPTIGIMSADWTNIDMAALGTSVADITRNEMSGTLPSTPGPWLDLGPGQFDYNTLTTETPSASAYSMMYLSALICAVERDVPGASQAWTTVYGTNGTDGGITNLQSFFATLVSSSRYNRLPRNG